MKILAYLIAGLLFNAVSGWAKPGSDDIGHLTLDHGIRIDYEVAPYANEAKGHKGGPIGPIFGTDSIIPHTVLKKLTVIQGAKRTPLDVSFMYDPWFERLDKSRFKVRVYHGGGLVLTGLFSDAAGSYVAEWLVVDGIGVRTLLSNESSVVRNKLLH